MVATTARAAIRIHVSDRVRALAFADNRIIILAVPRQDAVPIAHPGLTALGSDIEATRRSDREGHLYDFGLGVASSTFGVRTSDQALRNALNNCAGYEWPQLLAAAGCRILEASPARVIVNPIGRIEVFTPIPLPGEQTAPGPHTHFLPALLAAALETPPGMELAQAYASCLIYDPAKSGIPNDPH